MFRHVQAFRRRLLKSAFAYRQGPKPNIALFASRRGGSTLLAETIVINRGIWFVNEPFAYIEGHNSCTPEQRSLLRPRPHSQYLNVEDDEADSMEQYIEGLLHARLRRNGYLRRPKGIRLADRSLLKILNAGPLIDWMVERFELQPVQLLRHPGAQALSVSRCAWEWSTPAFLGCSEFVDRHLTPDQLELARRIEAGGSEFERGVLNWVLESLGPLRYEGPILRVSYEQLAVDPRPVIHRVADWLSLERREAMVRQVIGRPSGSSRSSTSETVSAIRSGDREALVRRWLKNVSDEDLANGQRILDAFGIEWYRMDDPMPTGDMGEQPAGHVPAGSAADD